MINILVIFSKSASPTPRIRLQSCAALKFFLGFTQKILSLSASCIFEALSLNGQFSAFFDYYDSVYVTVSFGSLNAVYYKIVVKTTYICAKYSVEGISLTLYVLKHAPRKKHEMPLLRL